MLKVGSTSLLAVVDIGIRVFRAVQAVAEVTARLGNGKMRMALDRLSGSPIKMPFVAESTYSERERRWSVTMKPDGGVHTMR